MATILVVEDDKSTRILTRARLKPYYNVILASDGLEALDKFYENPVDLVLADVMMPNMDGFELVRSLREYNHNVPVILLTAKTSFEDKREGFSTGIDDYMTKPVNYEELLWRIEALLRRAGINSTRKITISDVTLDEQALTVTRGSQPPITLPKKEFELLYKLLSYPGQIFTRDQLLESIWGLDTETNDSTVKTHINRLRNRFGDWTEFQIITIRGLGYKAEI